jgi:hypothetical protein
MGTKPNEHPHHGAATRRARTRYERTRSRARRQARAALAIPAAQVTGPDESSAAVRADGLPAEHPESMVLEFAPADEVWLALISDELWPCDEYQQIVAEDYRQRRDGAA